MTPRQQALMELLVYAGYPVQSSAAIVGNCSQEVGIDLPSKFTLKTDHGSQGIAQWRLERLTALEKFADDNKIPVTDLDTQGAFLIRELVTDYRPLHMMLLNPGTRSIANLTANFMTVFERPSFNPEINKLDFRIAQAEICARDFKPTPKAPKKAPFVIGATGTIGATAIVANAGINSPELAVIGVVLVAIAVIIGVWYSEHHKGLSAASVAPANAPSQSAVAELKAALEEYKLGYNRVMAARAVLLSSRQEGDFLLEQMKGIPNGNDK